MGGLVEQLCNQHTLDAEGLKKLLLCDDATVISHLYDEARKVAVRVFGRKVFLRGLIEISNHCKNNCYYCGLRRDNRELQRYRLTADDILECCGRAYRLGFRTFVMQGGEDTVLNDDWVTETVSRIKSLFPDCAVTLSLGEKSRESYRKYREAGADRYLLRHETHSISHYDKLHPKDMSYEHRMQCLEWLREIGFQVGCGMMVGSPGQTVDHLVEDLLYIRDTRPAMVGMGPFLPHHATPFANEPAGSAETTLRLISIVRLLLPEVLLPATTALGSLIPGGRLLGLKAGANVLMPNVSPLNARSAYALYDHKDAGAMNSEDDWKELEETLREAGFEIAIGRGDNPLFQSD
ncbi:MAG: [FeFe] hydrogenase H-cluster radical SAM maturase HydE [Prevotella sp.]|nr:[FeFe] hydrogenase H-cluster radical SAM maturase HydE [Prevotella sp.]